MSQVDVKVGQSLTEKEEEMSQAVVDDLYKKLDETNKNLASLYKIVDDQAKSDAKKIDELYKKVDNLNKAVFK